MMLSIRVEFLHGTVRAGSPDDVAITGDEDPGEWPPSPARLFSALVAADGTGVRCRVTDGSELTTLEAAAPPQILADSPDKVFRAFMKRRFVVVDEHTEGSVQEYPARTFKEVRPSTRISPATAEVTYIWPDLNPSPAVTDALRRRGARIGYLGCSDSPVRVRVSNSEEILETTDGRVWEPDDSGSATLPVPYEGFTSALDSAYDNWLTSPVRRAWLRTERARYLPPGERTARESSPTVFWLRFEGSVSARRALNVTETLRAAVLDLYQRQAPEPDEVPSVVHGHGFEGRGYHHAQWLALPDVGFPHSTGNIHGAAVWLPAGADPEVVIGVRQALGHLRQLSCPQRFHVGVRVHGGEQRPKAALPARWIGPSRRWISAFPVVHERWTSGGPNRAEVERWLEHSGCSASIVSFRTSPVPLLTGSPNLRPGEVHRPGRSRHPYSFFELMLDREIKGPLVIGRGRQFGLGLMLPQQGTVGG